MPLTHERKPLLSNTGNKISQPVWVIAVLSGFILHGSAVNWPSSTSNFNITSPGQAKNTEEEKKPSRPFHPYQLWESDTK